MGRPATTLPSSSVTTRSSGTLSPARTKPRARCRPTNASDGRTTSCVRAFHCCWFTSVTDAENASPMGKAEGSASKSTRRACLPSERVLASQVALVRLAFARLSSLSLVASPPPLESSTSKLSKVPSPKVYSERFGGVRCATERVTSQCTGASGSPPPA